MSHVTTRAFLLSVTALAAALATGCVPAESEEETTEEDIGEAESGVIGGAQDTTHSRVVSIQVPVNGKRVHWCTGYVVGSRAVITAAHCVCDDHPASKFTFHNASSALGTEPMAQAATGTTLKVKETVLMNGSCAGGWDGADVALLVLNKHVNLKGVNPGFSTTFYSFPKEPGAKKLDVYGYGRTVSNQKSPGIRKKVQVEFDENDSATAFLTRPFKQSGKFNGTLCNGDSGAPIFVSGDHFVGVHSAGDALCQNGAAGFHKNTRLVSTSAGDNKMKKIENKLLELLEEDESFGVLRRLRPDCEGDGTYASTQVHAVSKEHANELYDCPGGSNPKSWFDAGPAVTGECNGCPNDDDLGNDAF